MDYLSIIKHPITTELDVFVREFNDSLSHSDGLLAQALEHIRQRGGKRMRPILTLLMAKNFGHKGAITAFAVMLATLCSAFTLTGWLFLLKTMNYI